MKDNDWKKRLNIVYSTNPDMQYESIDDEPEPQTLPPEKQKLKVVLDRKTVKAKTRPSSKALSAPTTTSKNWHACLKRNAASAVRLAVAKS